LAVVGFDGIPEAAYFWPPLSTVEQDMHQLGCVAVDQVVRMIEASRESASMVRQETTWLEPRLIVRESSLASPKTAEVSLGEGSFDSATSLGL
jgi:DNA-binding LacI/PurR family transcriptional regulator